MKSAYIDNIICKVDPGDRIQNFADIFKEWILILFDSRPVFGTYISDIVKIAEAVKKLLENKNIPVNVEELFEEKEVFNKLPDCEKVCFSIMKYYNNLEAEKAVEKLLQTTINQ